MAQGGMFTPRLAGMRGVMSADEKGRIRIVIRQPP